MMRLLLFWLRLCMLSINQTTQYGKFRYLPMAWYGYYTFFLSERYTFYSSRQKKNKTKQNCGNTHLDRKIKHPLEESLLTSCLANRSASIFTDIYVCIYVCLGLSSSEHERPCPSWERPQWCPPARCEIIFFFLFLGWVGGMNEKQYLLNRRPRQNLDVYLISITVRMPNSGDNSHGVQLV